VVDLPDGRRAALVSVLSIKTSGWVVPCEVPAAKPREMADGVPRWV
jgi:hypothetical protein